MPLHLHTLKSVHFLWSYWRNTLESTEMLDIRMFCTCISLISFHPGHLLLNMWMFWNTLECTFLTVPHSHNSDHSLLRYCRNTSDLTGTLALIGRSIYISMSSYPFFMIFASTESYDCPLSYPSLLLYLWKPCVAENQNYSLLFNQHSHQKAEYSTCCTETHPMNQITSNFLETNSTDL